MILINIIGAGNLGKTIGRLLVKNNVATIAGVCNQSEKNALNAIVFMGEGTYYSTISALPYADITFITTPDALIETACAEYSQNKNIKAGSVVLHCSGSLTSDALSSVKQQGLWTASVHPMKSFAKPELSVEQYHGAFCAMEGDLEALKIIKPLFDAIGSTTYLIDKHHKSAYHAAGVFASNYLVTLSEQALSCMKFAGIEEGLAMDIITNIMSNTVSNLKNTRSPSLSLTGPIQRGDLLTIQKHMDILPNQQQALYSILGEATVALTSHDDDKKTAIKNGLLLNSI